MTQHITDIIGFLNEHADYAVLRNFEGLPDKNDSRDIDIIITKASLKKVLKPLVRMIDKSGWKIVTYLDSDRLTTLVCGRCNDSGTQLVQWDFFINTSVWGLELMSAEEFLKHREWNGFLWYVGTDCQFLDKYLYNRAVGAPYPEKYRMTREAAEHSSLVEEKLLSIFGRKSIEECDAVKGRGLLKAVVKANMKHPVRCVSSISKFLYTFARNYLRSNTGFSIGFTGPDGAGKTTVINMVLKELGDVFAKAYVYYHFRPTLFGNISEVAHKAGVKNEVDRDYDHPHRSKKKGMISSFCRLAYYSIDYIVGYRLKVKTQTRITRLVIFDRYYTDIICDSRRSSIFLPVKFLYGFGKLFIPSLDYNILLTASTDVILSRKSELDAEGVRDINERIDYLAGHKCFYKVTNNGSPEECARKIISLIFDKQHEDICFRIRL